MKKFLKSFFNILSLFIDFIFSEIPNILQLLAAIFIFVFLIDQNRYFQIILCFSYILYIYLIIRACYFLKDEIINQYSFTNLRNLNDKKVRFYFIALISVIVVLITVVFSKVVFEIKIERMKDEYKIEEMSRKVNFLIDKTFPDQNKEINNLIQKEILGQPNLNK